MAYTKPNSIIDEKDIKAFIKLLANNWYVFVIFLVVAFAIASINIHRTTKIYAASTTLLLKSEQKTDLRGAILQGLGIYSNYEDLASEMRVITSAPLIQKAISKLNLDISYFIVGRLKTTEVYRKNIFIVNANIYNYDYYSIDFNVTVLDRYRYRLWIENEGYRYDKVHKFGEHIANADFYAVLHRNERFFTKHLENNLKFDEITYKFRVNNRANLVNKYKNSLYIENEDWTAITQIYLEDEIPERAIEFLDTLANEYLDNSIERTKQININTLAFIDEQLVEVVDSLNKIEESLEDYKKKNIRYNNKNTSVQYLSDLKAADKDKFQLMTNMAFLDDLYNHVSQNKHDTVLLPSILGQEYDPQIVRAINELFDLQKKREFQYFNNKDNSLTIKELDDQISTLKKYILGYLVNTKEALKKKTAYLDTRIATLESIVEKAPRVQRDIVNIERKLNINENIYVYLLQKKAETIIAKAGIVANKRVIEPASSHGVVKPDKQAIMFNYLGIGFVLSLLVVFVRKVFFETIDSKDDLEDLSTVPVIGVIGNAKDMEDEYLAVDKSPKSTVAEAFRAVRINFQYLVGGEKCKTILITSFAANEGKTFCSINLAITLAKSGKRVCMVGMDIHKPKLHRAFKLANDIGISTLLIGKSSLDDSIKFSGIENLDVLLAGPIAPNASELLTRQDIHKMIGSLKEQYDFLVLDTPPMSVLTDALVFMKDADINLFVLKSHFAKKGFVRFAHGIKEKNNPSNFCFVLNNVKKKKFLYGYGASYGYNYGYGYGYEYGYGYGYGYGQENS